MATASTTKMQQQGKNLVVTDEGSRILGKFIRDYRTGLSPEMRLEDLMEKIK